MVMLKPKHKKGFTLVELTVVIIVMTILISIAYVSYVGIKKRSNEVRITSDLGSASVQLSKDNSEVGKYPDNLSAANNGNGLDFRSELIANYVYIPSTNVYCLSLALVDDPLVIFYLTSESKTVYAGICPDMSG